MMTRDLKGYGRYSPIFRWPNDSRIAIQLAVNYEAGAETNVLYGDATSEGRLNDTPVPAIVGERVPLVESTFEYGSRRGIWRLLETIENSGVKVSLFGSGMALERNPDVGRAFATAGHELVGHGYRWIDYRSVDVVTQREHIRRTIEIITDLAGKRPVGWMSGSPTAVTRKLLIEDGGFLYDRDSLADDVPYFATESDAHLIIPYSYETNDMRFGKPGGFVTGEDFYAYLRSAFEVLYREGSVRPQILSIGVHDRIAGRPARAEGLMKFLDYATRQPGVWFATGEHIAAFWTGLQHEGRD